MIDRVYVVTKGSYSDYHICAVTAEKKRAEELKIMYTDYYEKANVEEYKLNECVERFLFGVVFDSDGNFAKIEADDYCMRNEEMVDDWSGDGLTCWVFAKDADHAKKKAQDKRAEYLARREHID